jgi:tRNA(fMet)-specific endonuclease VapC
MVGWRYLADTNVLSERLLPRPNPGIIAGLAQHEQQIVTAAPVWHELRFGTARMPPSRKQRELERYLNDVVSRAMPILPYDRAAADWHAAERARLISLGRRPPFVDGQIAAIAATNGLTLVTANLADFVGFAGLQVEDWRTS